MPELPRDPPPAGPADDEPDRSTLHHSYRLDSRPPNELSFLSPPRERGELGRLAEFRVLRELGRGGMGVVLLAEDTKLGRRVALKVIGREHSQHPDAKRRFLREAAAVATIKNDHVVTLYQFGEANDSLFFAVELLEGTSLDNALTQGLPPLKDVLRIGRETAEGLAAAHRHGQIHRDIKPHNLWLEAPTNRIKILDFGLVHVDASDGVKTHTGMLMGTPDYMSPEQARTQHVDARTDLFSLGTVLYQLCTGQLPFRRPNRFDTLDAVVRHFPPPVCQVNANIPQALSDLIERLMAKDAQARPQSADEVVRAIRAIEHALSTPQVQPSPFADLDTEITESAPKNVPVVMPKRSRNSTLLAAIAAGIVIVGATVALIVRGGKQREPSSPVVEKKPVAEKKVVIPELKKKDDPAKAEDLDRRAALWVRSLGGSVSVRERGNDRHIKPTDSLPESAFELRGIYLSQLNAVNDDSLKNLRGLRHLRVLDLDRTQVSGRNLSALVECPALDDLNLLGVQVTDEALQQIASLPLHVLRIDSVELTDFGVAHIEKMPLYDLRLGGTRLTDRCLTRLKGLLGLETLHLGSPLITANGLNQLPAFPKLTNLQLCGNGYSDGVVDYILKLPALEELTLQYFPLRPGQLRRLAESKKLKQLMLDGMTFAGTDLKAFRAARPDCLAFVDSRQDSDGPFPPLDPEWLKTLPAKHDVARFRLVADEFRRRNPLAVDAIRHGIKDGLVGLIAFESEELIDLTPMQALPMLKIIDCKGKSNILRQPNLRELEPLRGLKLMGLTVTGAPVKDLSPLTGMPLEALAIEGTRIRDLQPLERMPLTELFIGNTEVTDLSPLKGMQLATLDIHELPSAAKIDAAFLNDLPLEVLYVTPEQVTNLNLLRQHKTLKKINSLPVDIFWKKQADLTADPDRWYAEVIRVYGGKVAIRLQGKTVELSATVELPAQPFHVVEIVRERDKKIGDGALFELRSLKQLESLTIPESNLSGAGMRVLSYLPALRKLDLGSTVFWDYDLDRLTEVKQLRKLTIAAGRITPAGLKAYLAAVPECEVTIDGIRATEWLKKK